jgi:hypothetical protein
MYYILLLFNSILLNYFLHFKLALGMVNLFFNWYQHDSRQQEIDQCLEKNKLIFDKVITVSGRPTFEQLFKLSADYPNDINVFCNSDIYFKETESLKSIKENECYALTRWENKQGRLHFLNRVDSQDAWVFKGVVKNIKANFTTGLWGCDNRLLHEIEQAGYTVLNPSLSIITVHLHEVDNRNQDRTRLNTVSPPYKTLAPCAL